MSATGLGLEESPEQAYFKAIELAFLRLRDSGGMLTPADWQVARGWFAQQIPLEVVIRALEELFERRRQSGAKKRYVGLRFCAPAVEAAWEEVSSLEASGRVAPGEELDVRARQRALARALPAALPERERWAAALLALEGGIAQVEAGLAELELRLHQELASREEGDPGAEVERRLEQALARLGSRLSAPELEQARQRLARQALRERWGLPTLSLFAPEAETDSG